MAGLIPQSFIDGLLTRADIVEVIDKRIKLRKTGRNYQALCPFHQEKSPSFSVEPDKQFYYCFGCGAGGNALGFIMNYDNVEFPEAVEMLAAEYGMDVPRESGAESAKQAEQKSEQTRLLELLARASKFYQFQLRQHAARAQAVNYLKSRGLSGDIAREYQLGYAPPGWDNLLTALGEDAGQRKLLELAGLVIRKDSAGDGDAEAANKTDRQYYDRFRHRIMFPIRNTKGQVIGFGGRVLGNDKPKYLNSPETPVFHKGSELYGLYEAKRASGKFEQLLIVEGYLDVIALAQSGIHNAVATLGTATSANHLKRLFRLVSHIVFCFDGDEAGRTAAWRALQTVLPLVEDGRNVGFLFLDQGEDPDSLVRKVGKAQFLALVNKATPLENFLFDKLSQGLDLNSLEDRARLAKQAKPLLGQLPRGIYRQLMMDRLSNRVGLDSQAMAGLLSGEPPGPPPDMPALPEYARAPAYGSPQRVQMPARYRKPWSLKAIELLLHKPEIASSRDRDLTPLQDADGENSRMLLSLVELARQNPHIETFTLLGYCYGTQVGNQLTQLLQEEKITPLEGAQDEFWQILDSKLSSLQQKADVDRKLQVLKDKLGAGNGENPV